MSTTTQTVADGHPGWEVRGMWGSQVLHRRTPALFAVVSPSGLATVHDSATGGLSALVEGLDATEAVAWADGHLGKPAGAL